MRSSNKIKVEGGMSSMTDLVFLLLIFLYNHFYIRQHLTSNTITRWQWRTTSLTSPVKIYVDAQNQFYINGNEEPIGISKIESRDCRVNWGKQSHRTSCR